MLERIACEVRVLPPPTFPPHTLHSLRLLARSLPPTPARRCLPLVPRILVGVGELCRVCGQDLSMRGALLGTTYATAAEETWFAGIRVILDGGVAHRCGRVRSEREQSHGASDTFVFLELNGGSCQGNLQIFVKGEAVCRPLALLPDTGTSVLVDWAKHGVGLAVNRVLDERVGRHRHIPAAQIRDFAQLRARTYLILHPTYTSGTSAMLSPIQRQSEDLSYPRI